MLQKKKSYMLLIFADSAVVKFQTKTNNSCNRWHLIQAYDLNDR